jgi:hypothetical protein
MPNNIIEKEIEKFEKEFGDEQKYCCCSREYCYPGDQTYEIIGPIKSFLRTSLTSALKEQRESLVVEIEGKKLRGAGCGCYGFDRGLSTAIEIITNQKEQ